ncbi:MAG: hypothetical protein ACO3WM_06860, partial [Gemmobacter sp.]
MARFRAAHLARVVLTCAGMAAGATSNAGSPELRASLLGAATEAAASLAPPRERSEAYFALARARAALGDVARAESDARAIPDDYMRAEALALVAAAVARAGDVAGARALAAGIEDAREQSARSAAFEAVAIAQMQAGDIAGAFATTEAIEDLYRRAEAQSAVAKAQARGGDIAGALATAARIDSASWLAEARARDAYRFSEVIVEDLWYFDALAGIAAIEADRGETEAALALARTIRDPGWRARATLAVGLAQARAGDIAAAEATAAEI